MPRTIRATVGDFDLLNDSDTGELFLREISTGTVYREPALMRETALLGFHLMATIAVIDPQQDIQALFGLEEDS